MSGGPEKFAAQADAEDGRGDGLRNPLGGERRVRRMDAEDPRNPYVRPVQEMSFDLDHEVFLIYRPWEKCSRCIAALKNESLSLPPDGDHVCPHTRLKEYRQLLKDRSSGVCQIFSTTETTLKDGSVQVSVGIARPKTKKDADPRSGAERPGRSARW